MLLARDLKKVFQKQFILLFITSVSQHCSIVPYRVTNELGPNNSREVALTCSYRSTCNLITSVDRSGKGNGTPPVQVL